MSDKEVEWTEEVPEFAELTVGENTFEIAAEPYVETGKFGKRLYIPTNIGVWRISLNSPIARELKRIAQANNGKITHVTLTVVKTGKDKDTRYSIKKFVLPQQRQHTPPPKGQLMLNLENLTPEQKQQLQQILGKSQDVSETS